MKQENHKHSPIIIMGMHRSGTSLVTELLERLGLFVGARKDHNQEALFFLRLNEWLLRQCGGAWDEPGVFRHLLADRLVFDLSKDYVRFMLRTPRIGQFLGWRQYLRYRGVGKLDFPWGWKDPRNTFTFPFWHSLFPEARIIHVYRHGVDVAHSLQVRHDHYLRDARKIHERRKWLYWLHPKQGGFTDSIRCYDLEHAFALWDEYMLEAERQVQAMGDKAQSIRYEDFLADPVPRLQDLATFCGLTVDDETVREVTRSVRGSRALAYRQHPELCRFAEQVAPRLQRWGY